MRRVGQVLILAVLAVAAFKVAGWVLGVLAGTVLFALKLAFVGAFVAGAFWFVRRLGRKPKRKTLTGGSGSLDLDFIRGRIDKETYIRRGGK